MELRRPWNRSSKWALAVLSLCFSAGVWWAAESSTDSSDVSALLALQQAWGQWADSAALQWTGNDPCGFNWMGIQCDESSPQRVAYIKLLGLGLAGDLPADIGRLSALVTLDMSSNSLSGPIPDQIGQLTQLEILYLQFNNFTGKIPTQIGQVKNLSTLLLNGNQLAGQIPNEIGLLANLYLLDVAQNLLEGSLPYSYDGSSVRAGLDNLTKAGHFHLNNNSFSGSIPLSMCHPDMSLIHLNMQSVSVSGQIPSALFQLQTLNEVNLANNKINGTLDLRMATSPLLLVSMENNEITVLDPGNYNQVLRLQGNPVCTRPINTSLSAQVCLDNSSVSAPATNCSNINCTSGYVVNPRLCTCAIPYKGVFIFRAPLFTSLINTSRIPALATELAKKLSVNVEQVQLSGFFNPQNQLIVRISIFPSGSSPRWSRDDVMRMSSVLGNLTVSSHIFGPPMFQQYPYD